MLKARACIFRRADGYKGDVEIKTYNEDDTVRLKSFAKYTLKPSDDVWWKLALVRRYKSNARAISGRFLMEPRSTFLGYAIYDSSPPVACRAG